jgi:hypothetical protein
VQSLQLFQSLQELDRFQTSYAVVTDTQRSQFFAIFSYNFNVIVSQRVTGHVQLHQTAQLREILKRSEVALCQTQHLQVPTPLDRFLHVWSQLSYLHFCEIELDHLLGLLPCLRDLTLDLSQKLLGLGHWLACEKRGEPICNGI